MISTGEKILKNDIIEKISKDLTTAIDGISREIILNRDREEEDYHEYVRYKITPMDIRDRLTPDKYYRNTYIKDLLLMNPEISHYTMKKIGEYIYSIIVRCGKIRYRRYQIIMDVDSGGRDLGTSTKFLRKEEIKYVMFSERFMNSNYPNTIKLPGDIRYDIIRNKQTLITSNFTNIEYTNKLAITTYYQYYLQMALLVPKITHEINIEVCHVRPKVRIPPDIDINNLTPYESKKYGL